MTEFFYMVSFILAFHNKTHSQQANFQGIKQNEHSRCSFYSLMAPVEGLGPPTLRLTAECSTD